jgi:hypothetical protein
MRRNGKFGGDGKLFVGFSFVLFFGALIFRSARFVLFLVGCAWIVAEKWDCSFVLLPPAPFQPQRWGS